MLRKLKIWIYENWLKFFLAFFVAISFYHYSRLDFFFSDYIIFLIIYLFSWQIRGSLFQSLFFSILFLPLVFNYKNIILEENLINYFQNFNLFLSLALYFISFEFFKRKKVFDWIVFLLMILLILQFNFFERITLTQAIIFSLSGIILFSLFFLQNNLLITLIYTLIFFEVIFFSQFLPFAFYWRALFLLIFAILILKYDIIKS